MPRPIRVSAKAAIWARNASKLRIASSRSAKRIASLAIHQPNNPNSNESPKGQSTRKSEKTFNHGWREVNGRKIFFRSRWEANFGFYLEWQKQRKLILEWEHEPKTFWFDGIKRGCVTYLPDFKVTNLDGSHEWIEVKGYMDAKSKTKIRRFRKFFSEEKLRIVGSKWYKENCKKLSLIIPGWEK